jgi:hypothetical protein
MLKRVAVQSRIYRGRETSTRMPSKANSTTVGHRTRQALRGFRPVGSISAAAGDRVYTANQTSNMDSVIGPAANKLLGSIHLGRRRSCSAESALSWRIAGARSRLFAGA